MSLEATPRLDVYEGKFVNDISSTPLSQIDNKSSAIAQIVNNIWAGICFVNPLRFLAKNTLDLSIKGLCQLELTLAKTPEQNSPECLSSNNVNYVVPVVKEKLINVTRKVRSYFFGIPYDTTLQSTQLVQVIDGSLKEIISERDSPEFNKNTKIAKDIIRHVQQTIPFSSNYINRSRISTTLSNLSDSKKIFEFLQGIVDNLKSSTRGQTLEKTAESAANGQVGNCREMAAVGAVYGKTLGASVTVCSIRGAVGDHMFLVIGRDKNLPLEHSSYAGGLAWGKDAVVCDVWSGACYPAEELNKYLLDYVGLEFGDERIETRVRPFTPEAQVIDAFDVN